MSKIGPTTLLLTAVVGRASGSSPTRVLAPPGSYRLPHQGPAGTAAHLRDDRPTFARAVSRVAPAVVSIFATQTEPGPPPAE